MAQDSDEAARAPKEADERPDAALRAGSRAATLLDRLRQGRTAFPLLFGASFLEALIIPIPIELVLVPYMMAERGRIWAIATVTLAGCLAGALVGYGVGLLVLETVGRAIMDWGGWSESYPVFQDFFARHGFWAIVAVGILPIPFQVAMLAAGATAYPLVAFVAAVLLARGIRYHGLALIVRLYGTRALDLWRRHKTAAMALAALVLMALWGATRLTAAVFWPDG